MAFDPNDPKDAWQASADNLVYRFAQNVRALHEANPWPEVAFLDQAIVTLMTELWDSGFSQSEIKQAFEAAITEMPRYAGGQERMS